MPAATASGSGRAGFLLAIELVLLLLGLVLAIISDLIDRSRSALVTAVAAVFLIVGAALALAGL